MAHGGDIYRNKVNMDYSVNLNPLETRAEILTAVQGAISKAQLYPDILQQEVREAIADTIGLTSEYIYAGNGASELIMAAVRAMTEIFANPGHDGLEGISGEKKNRNKYEKRHLKALLFEPGFSGYEYALKAAGAEIVRHVLTEEKSFDLTIENLEALTNDIDVVFICDPNNPTGRRIDEAVLTTFLDKAKEKNITVCLDDSFYLMSDTEIYGHNRYSKEMLHTRSKLIEKYDNLIIITSLTKLFALPGIRMGYVVAVPDTIVRIRKQLPEWNLAVTSDAGIKAGMKLIVETDFIARTNEIISVERAFLSKELRNLGLKVYDSDTCFILFQGPQNLYDNLLERGILIRDCSDYNGLCRTDSTEDSNNGNLMDVSDGITNRFYRIAVRNHDDNEKLVEAMKFAINDNQIQ
ncbi:pyridoxal phosphate-dependent aminotransferase [Butyrivibrio sp. VCB2006]|uniref:pyridoxal phosphate-dependent aminotransferase n=1 Tax=Butyrivibrio sp. VCB2006 TaxID=1280679 RepID=UPI000492C52A|nr:histidinol-phosphate transaminase [Butyrivibrio sp. VCB2006]